VDGQRILYAIHHVVLGYFQSTEIGADLSDGEKALLVFSHIASKKGPCGCKGAAIPQLRFTQRVLVRTTLRAKIYFGEHVR
jgi:hypothetical protein